MCLCFYIDLDMLDELRPLITIQEWRIVEHKGVQQSGGLMVFPGWSVEVWNRLVWHSSIPLTKETQLIIKFGGLAPRILLAVNILLLQRYSGVL